MKINLFKNSVYELGERMLKFARNDDDYYTRPISLKRTIGLSMYMARKVIKYYFNNGYFEKIIDGGGNNGEGEPQAPWNGYKLTKEGYSLVDIKPHKNDSRRTVFVFELTQQLESRLQQEKEV